MTKLILKCGLALGDIVTLTAAVRDLHRCYPGQFLTDVRTSCEEVWEHNPYITPLDENDAEVWQIDCRYPLVDRANQGIYHCLHGFIDFLNQRLRLQIKPTAFSGDIYLSDREKAWFSQVHEFTRRPVPFWIIAAGGKHDVTIKWWDIGRYQEVVDHFRGKILFAQVGGRGHHHPKLEGVIDLRGRTNLRELIRLVYHSQGALCSVTALMHLAAAVGGKTDYPSLRPCVVVAGGREPVQWQQYPGHQFIHTIGALPCCLTGGCWRDRTHRLRDGKPNDKRRELCVDVAGRLPRCMDMIAPAEVARRIQAYFDGGALRFLSPREVEAAEKGVQASSRNHYDQQALTLSSAGMAFDEATESIRRDSSLPEMEGRGIVICGGGVRYFVNAWVCINMLRRHGCKLPIEVWHLGKKELTKEMSALLAPLQVKTVDAMTVRRAHPMRILNGWELKPYAIAYSQFQEVVFLDADNVPLLDPSVLFSTKRYGETGAVFWPDLNHVTGKNADIIWKSCGLPKPAELEFETGQIVIDKVRCWKAVRLSLWLNENSDFYYQHLHGDKETFHLAFRKLKKSYALIPKPVRRLRATMCQHDFAGRRIFQHRNMDKWDLFGNLRISGFRFERECLRYVHELRTIWDGGVGAVKSPPPRKSFRTAARLSVGVIVNGDVKSAKQTYQRLKDTDWEGHIAPLQLVASGGKPSDEINILVEQSLDEGAAFILLLQGDLIFNRHLHANLSGWLPLQKREANVASLYNPRVKEFACDVGNNVRFVDPLRLLRTEAILISAEAAKILLAKRAKRREDGAPDFPAIARRLNSPALFHAPSLVQRLPPADAQGAEAHRAFDFHPDWRL